MKKVVNFCGNCPFLYNEYDSYDGSTQHLCVLSRNLDLYFDYVDTVEGVFDENSTPTWCPLKVEDYTFSFKEFSNKRLEEIQNVKEKINEIYEQIESNDNDNDNDNDDVLNELNEIEILNTELSNLYTVEEIIETEEITDDDIQTEISKSIEEIKNQMSYIEEASAKLQETFNKFSEE